MLDALQNIMAFKTLWSLCSVNKKGGMRVVYFTICLVHGKAPLWGVWNVNGKFLHFAGGRDSIADMHPQLSWRRVMARWQLADESNSEAAARRRLLAEELKAELPVVTLQVPEKTENPKLAEANPMEQVRRRPGIQLH